MAAAAKVIPVPWDAERIAALQPSLAASPWGPMEGPGDVFGGSYLFEYTRAGERALMALRPERLADGIRVDVVGLVSLGDRLNAAAVIGAMERIALDAKAHQLAMCTRHAHVVRQCARLGWQETGTVMTKMVYVQ